MFAKVFLISEKNNRLPESTAVAAARNFKRRKGFFIGTGNVLEF